MLLQKTEIIFQEAKKSGFVCPGVRAAAVNKAKEADALGVNASGQ